jgi:hypothetical protein
MTALEMVIVVQMIKNLPAFYGTHRTINVLCEIMYSIS